jgi:hypothetical protein
VQLVHRGLLVQQALAFLETLVFKARLDQLVLMVFKARPDPMVLQDPQDQGLQDLQDRWVQLDLV